MGFFGNLRSAALVLFGGPAVDSAQGLLGGILPYGIPPKRGTRELLQAFKTVPWLRATVQKIAFECATKTELELWKKGPSTSTRAARRALRSYTELGGLHRSRAMRRRDMSDGGLSELDSHPFLDLLDNPCPAMSTVFWRFVVQGFLETKGECPIVIERGTDGLPLELWPVPPHWLWATPTKNAPWYRFTWQGWRKDIPENDVLYLKHPDLENPYGRGSGVGETMGDELDTDEFVSKHIRAFFFNRALPDIFLSVEGMKDKDEAQRWEKDIRNKHRGHDRAWQMHVTNGKINLTQVGQSFKNMELIELRKYDRDLFLQVFGVPPEVIGVIENSNRATVDAAYYNFARGVLQPRGIFLADELTTLAKEWDDGLIVVPESPVAADTAFQLQVMQNKPDLFYKNEWRTLAGFEPVDDFEGEFATGPVSVAPGGPGGAAPALPAGTQEPAGESDEDEEQEEADEETTQGERSLARLRGAG
jgi:hypothetical protein